MTAATEPVNGSLQEVFAVLRKLDGNEQQLRQQLAMAKQEAAFWRDRFEEERDRVLELQRRLNGSITDQSVTNRAASGNSCLSSPVPQALASYSSSDAAAQDSEDAQAAQLPAIDVRRPSWPADQDLPALPPICARCALSPKSSFSSLFDVNNALATQPSCPTLPLEGICDDTSVLVDDDGAGGGVGTAAATVAAVAVARRWQSAQLQQRASIPRSPSGRFLPSRAGFRLIAQRKRLNSLSETPISSAQRPESQLPATPTHDAPGTTTQLPLVCGKYPCLDAPKPCQKRGKHGQQPPQQQSPHNPASPMAGYTQMVSPQGNVGVGLTSPGSLRLHWLHRPRTALVVCKPSDDVLRHLVNVAHFLLEQDVRVFVEPSVGERLDSVLSRLTSTSRANHAATPAARSDEQQQHDDQHAQHDPHQRRRSDAQTACDHAEHALQDKNGTETKHSSMLCNGVSSSMKTHAVATADTARSGEQACQAPSSRNNATQLSSNSTTRHCGDTNSANVCSGQEHSGQRLHSGRSQEHAAARTAGGAGSDNIEGADGGMMSDDADEFSFHSCHHSSSFHERATCVMQQLLSWDASGHPNDAPYIAPDVAGQLDFIVTLGGDGTVIWTCSMLGDNPVPPLVPFALGSLGFLTPFPIDSMESLLRNVVQGDFPLMLRHRLEGYIVRGGVGDSAESLDKSSTDDDVVESFACLNEVVVDRGMEPNLSNLEVWCDDVMVTNVQGDGLILATPTGSTAYNLSAGGSMVHPEMPGILFTPKCPHSLSFRPLIFPDHVTLRVQLPTEARNQKMWCVFDQRNPCQLLPGDALIVRMSAWPVPTVCDSSPSQDWFRSVREGLYWNLRKMQGGK